MWVLVSYVEAALFAILYNKVTWIRRQLMDPSTTPHLRFLAHHERVPPAPVSRDRRGTLLTEPLPQIVRCVTPPLHPRYVPPRYVPPRYVTPTLRTPTLPHAATLPPRCPHVTQLSFYTTPYS